MDAPALLKEAFVPTSDADCRFCPDPCNEGHESYPNKFGVDMESDMLGSTKPYRRQVLISTNKSDWAREVTDVSGTLAAYLSKAQSSAPSSNVSTTSTSTPGVFQTSDSKNLSILNGSHDTVCDDQTQETVLVLPDFKVVVDVPRTLEGAQALWEHALDPAYGRAGRIVPGSLQKTYVLPYSCVILICSHKKRDNKCHIAAPKLEHELIQSFERAGWESHTQLEDPSFSSHSPLESLEGPQDEREAQVLEQLKAVQTEKKALILRCSHIGGHRYAGNLIIYTPQGASIWYGRVTTHEVESVVQNTIINGLVLPTLLRGGLNISRPGCKSLHEW